MPMNLIPNDRFSVRVEKSFNALQAFILAITGTIATLTGIQKALLALVIAVNLDFITGCIASWSEHKKNEDKIKVYFLESKKIRLSIVKCIAYALFILFTWLFSVLYFNQPMSIHSSLKSLTATEIATGICIGVEVFSNIENLKRAGFDLIGKIKNMVLKIYELKNLINSGK